MYVQIYVCTCTCTCTLILGNQITSFSALSCTKNGVHVAAAFDLLHTQWYLRTQPFEGCCHHGNTITPHYVIK